ncbi:MAG: insulinase family protein [SAR324 cluster bacterium]|uniref:Insulinase family protein n=1 Tax=SAR324 cluster bacterium TaxID=2024889 RepID=A0A7X9IJX4_9DELT|nr:insulinase family protein [SAR324 cluster bacterium]
MNQYEKSIASSSNILGLRHNGRTGKDFSSFSVSTITPGLVEVARNMLDAIFSEESVENKDSIEQERRLIGREIEENASTLNALRITAEYLLTLDSSFSHPVTGFPETLETISQKDLESWKLQHYVAPKTAMTIVGKIPDTQLSDLTEMLNSLPINDSQDEVSRPLCHQRAMSKELPRQSNTNQHWVMFAFPAEAASDPTTTSTSLLFDIATDPAGSRLSRLLRHDTGAAYSLYRRTMAFRDLGYCVCAFKTSESHHESVLAKTRDLFEIMRESGPSEEEIQAAKLKMIASLIPLLEQQSSLSCLLEEGAMYKYDPLSFSELNSSLEAPSSTKVKKLTERLFDSEKMVVVTK